MWLLVIVFIKKNNKNKLLAKYGNELIQIYIKYKGLAHSTRCNRNTCPFHSLHGARGFSYFANVKNKKQEMKVMLGNVVAGECGN
jgi:hypothetical protein